MYVYKVGLNATQVEREHRRMNREARASSNDVLEEEAPVRAME